MALKRRLLFILLLSAMALPAQAQFIGYVGLQTTSQTALNAVAAAGPSAVLRNIGQSAHYVTYSVTGCTNLSTTSVQIVIEGSFDGTTFIQISNIATDPSSGFLFAHGYFAAVRVNLLEFTCAPGPPALTARYSGISTSPGEPQGQAIASLSVTRLVNLGPLSATTTAVIPTLDGHSGGVLTWRDSGTCTPGSSQVRLEALSEFPTNATNSGRSRISVASFDPGAVTDSRVIPVPSVPAQELRFRADNINLTTPATCTVSVLYASDRRSDVRQNIVWRFNDRTSTGLFAACPTGCTETFLNVGIVAATIHTVQLTTSGAPTSCTFELEGSLNNQAYFSLSGPISCLSSTTFQISDRPVSYIRGNLTALAGGVAPRVAFAYEGAAH